jgi:hypothetical protein
MDFDPRDCHARENDRFAANRHGDDRGAYDRDNERDDDWSRSTALSPDRHDGAPSLGRGPGDSREANSSDRARAAHDDARWPDREGENRPRDSDPRDVFTRHLDLPRGREREVVRDRGREYTLRDSESRTLATVGAFRVVSSRDLHDNRDRPLDPRSSDLRHLREQRLVEVTRLAGSRDYAVSLTREGRSLLEGRRDRDQEGRQTFYAGVKRERELEHDVQVYCAFEREAERLEERGARVDRVVLDYELKREYQQWLHAHDRDRGDYDGHPDRDRHEIEEWAREHDLPYFDEQVHFPDARIEYEGADGRWDHVDVEVLTVHYRGAHGAAAARSGFSCFRGSSACISGSAHLGGLADEVLE